MGERIDALEARAADSYEEEIQEKKSQASLNAPK